MLKRFILLTLALSSFPLCGQQSNDAVILGSVTDVSLAAVAGATVTVTSAATSSVTQVQANSRGE